jgi:hypothetical protein
MNKNKLLISLLENTIKSCKNSLNSIELFLDYLKYTNNSTNNENNIYDDDYNHDDYNHDNDDKNNIYDDDDLDELKQFKNEINNIDLQQIDIKPSNTDIEPSTDKTNNVNVNDELREDNIEYSNDVSKDFYDLEDNTDFILKKRIHYHKEQGTYEEPKIAIEKKIPTIDPLLTISPEDRDVITKSIFKEAIYNVETLMNISRNDSSFETSLNKEADRLLDVWRELRRAKKI